MRYRLLLLIATALLSARALHADAPPIEAFVAPGLKDITSTVNVKLANTTALTKVSKDFANSYRMKTMRITYKDPGMMRMEGKAGPLTIVYILNGDKKGWQIGAIKGSKDVSKQPAQKQGLMDFGLLTKDQLADYDSQFLRTEVIDGIKTYVYELRYKVPTENLRRVVWIDPVKKYIVRRQVFGREGQLKMEHRFSQPKLVGGVIWVPTVIKVYNAQGELGAVSDQVVVRVNAGIPDDQFRI
ncbi:MAG: outer membrane lipoprotein-sorting protein [Armatimonadota bacterium]